MDLSWTVDRAGDASLVRCRVSNDESVSRRVRVESRFDAPVLPPRRAGVPEAGWDATGVTLQIGPGERRGFGFAAPSSPVNPPVAITSVEAVNSDASPHEVPRCSDDDGTAGSAAAGALRDLDEFRPPRTAVDEGRDVTEAPVCDRDCEADDPRDERLAVDDSDDSTEGCRDARRDTDEPGRAGSDAVDGWLTAVEARVDRVERLTDADVETATTVVADAGGVDALATLDERVAWYAERLKVLSERAASLAERAAASDVPVEALERLA
jgi:hypothetical protein